MSSWTLCFKYGASKIYGLGITCSVRFGWRGAPSISECYDLGNTFDIRDACCALLAPIEERTA